MKYKLSKAFSKISQLCLAMVRSGLYYWSQAWNHNLKDINQPEHNPKEAIRMAKKAETTFMFNYPPVHSTTSVPLSAVYVQAFSEQWKNR